MDTVSSTGSCFAFEVRSDLSFAFLRGGSGDPLEVVEAPDPGPPSGEPLIRWDPKPDHPFEARLHADGDGYRFWVRDVGTYDVRPADRRIAIPAGAAPIPREERLWGIPTVLCFLDRGDHSLHAGAVDVGGAAVAFGAPGRHGKTTLASAFVAAGYRLLSEDSTCLRPGAVPEVLPGPAMLRVRPDSYARLEIPGADVLLTEPDRVHLALDPATRGGSDPVPLAGLVMLRTHDEPSIDLTPVPPDQAIQDLWTLSFHPPTDEGRAACFERITALATTVPIWNLTRRLRYDDLADVIDAIAATVRA